MSERDYDNWRAKIRRNELADAKLCINARSHGSATHGVRCAWCAAVHKFGVVAVLARSDAPRRPLNYKPRIRSLK